MKKKLLGIFSLVVVIGLIIIFSIHYTFYKNPETISLLINDESSSDLALAKKIENDAVQFDSYYIKGKRFGYFTDVRKNSYM